MLYASKFNEPRTERACLIRACDPRAQILYAGAEPQIEAKFVRMALAPHETGFRWASWSADQPQVMLENFRVVCNVTGGAESAEQQIQPVTRIRHEFDMAAMPISERLAVSMFATFKRVKYLTEVLPVDGNVYHYLSHVLAVCAAFRVTRLLCYADHAARGDLSNPDNFVELMNHESALSHIRGLHRQLVT